MPCPDGRPVEPLEYLDGRNVTSVGEVCEYEQVPVLMLRRDVVPLFTKFPLAAGCGFSARNQNPNCASPLVS